jgi:hypothetical protein
MKEHEIKARALVLSYYGIIHGINTNEAKKCALIVVNEILDLGFLAKEPSSKRIYDFYSKVKIAIDKI